MSRTAASSARSTSCVAPPRPSVSSRKRSAAATSSTSSTPTGIVVLTPDAPPRSAAEALDRDDPLASFRDRFAIADDDLVYVDGNSLGRLPSSALERVRALVEEEWGRGLVRSWSTWIDHATAVGDRIGESVLGAAPGQVAIADSTTVNLYKLASAALDARPGRRVIVTDVDNFPSDRYVFEGLAQARGLELRWLHADPVLGPQPAEVEQLLDDDVALVSLSHVAYKSGAIAAMDAITAAAHRAGALVLWDLSHSAGSVPLALDADGCDLAVGCTYKYLNGGPGAPAFLYVREALQPELRQPIWGWFGQRDQFAMGPTYDPSPDIRRFLVGTPPILAMAAVAEGIDLIAEAGIDRLREKSVRATSLMVELFDAWLAPLGFSLASPRDPNRRGSHVSVAHPEAWQMSQALIAEAVVPDFREPDVVRLGFAPIYGRFTDAWDAIDRLRDIAASGRHREHPVDRHRVT